MAFREETTGEVQTPSSFVLIYYLGGSQPQPMEFISHQRIRQISQVALEERCQLDHVLL